MIAQYKQGLRKRLANAYKKAFASMKTEKGREAIALMIIEDAETFYKENSRFNRVSFYEKCGLKKGEHFQ